MAACVGALLPDLSLYLMAGWALHVQQIPTQVVFDELYFSTAWQNVFAIDNSIPLWLAGLVLALLSRNRAATAFASAGLLHLGLDLILHAGDGRPHFWPVTTWVFHSPVSYWDSQHGAGWVVPIAAAACVLAALRLWPVTGWMGRAGVMCLLTAELWVARQWLLFF